MIPQSQATLTRLENLFRELGYKIRYEKGNFRTGACLIRDAQVVVINKFVTLDQKIQSLTEIILNQELNVNDLDEKQRQFIQVMRQTKLKL